MQAEKTIAVDSKSSESCTGIDPRVEFVIGASLHEDYSETDFVHSIVGRIFAKVEGDAEEKEAGGVKASLVQFGEAMDHGITRRGSATVLMGISPNTGSFYLI